MVMLKMMGAEDAPDNDSRKSFMLIDGLESVNFKRPEDAHGAFAYLVFKSGETRCVNVHGNCYVLNDGGKTVASFGVTPLPRHNRESR